MMLRILCNMRTTFIFHSRRSFAFKSCELRIQRTDEQVDGTCTLRYAKHILTWYFPPLRYPTPAPMLFAYILAACWWYKQRRQVEVCGSLWAAAQLSWVGIVMPFVEMTRVLMSVWVKRIERRGSSLNLFGTEDTQEMRQLCRDWPIRLTLETMLSSLEKNLEGANITPPRVVLAYSRVSSLKCILPRTLMLSIVTSFFPVPTALGNIVTWPM